MRGPSNPEWKSSKKEGWKSREFTSVRPKAAPLSVRTSAPVESQNPPTLATSPKSTRKQSIQLLSRTIDTVVLGNISFETWYYSPYPENVILLKEQNSSSVRSKGAFDGDIVNGAYSAPSPSTASITSATCPQLYVCPYCFRYTPFVAAYISHLRHHKHIRTQNPDTPPVPESSTKIYEHDGYAVWEVKGEIEKLYCQNLSLFGKLFLEQKSVFFDTGGFDYYVLTYTPPERLSSPQKKRGGHKRGPSYSTEDLGLETQVLGFFSKESPSWDSNNLACILVFPPFQHRQLGKLLMSVSYKLSAWEWEEGIIGGPEKPLSEMGRRSYLRFWAERVARFMLGQSADAEGERVFERGRRKRSGPRKEDMTVKEIGERTGMLAEDVVAALGEMGICELMLPKKKKKKSEEINGTHTASQEEENMASMIVKRSKVKEWVDANNVDLQDPVREEGFLGEWAMSEPDEDEDEEGEIEEDVDGSEP
jgi:hypothetical protein